MERRDAVFRRKLAHTDGAKVVDSRLDEWSYARTDGLGRGRAAERNVKMRGLARWYTQRWSKSCRLLLRRMVIRTDGLGRGRAAERKVEMR